MIVVAESLGECKVFIVRMEKDIAVLFVYLLCFVLVYGKIYQNLHYFVCNAV